MAAGVFGYLGYDMARQMERLAAAKPDPIGVPDAMMLRPTVMVVFDAVQRRDFRRDAAAPRPRRLFSRRLRTRAGADRSRDGDPRRTAGA